MFMACKPFLVCRRPAGNCPCVDIQNHKESHYHSLTSLNVPESSFRRVHNFSSFCIHWRRGRGLLGSSIIIVYSNLEFLLEQICANWFVILLLNHYHSLHLWKFLSILGNEKYSGGASQRSHIYVVNCHISRQYDRC